MEITCVRCKEKMKVRELHGAKIDICIKCNGMFWDKGEMNKVTNAIEGDIEYSSIAGDTFNHSDIYPITDCPRCKKVKMKKIDFNVYTEIILDYCDSCNGFWVDGGELQKMNQEIDLLKEASTKGNNAAITNIANFFWSIRI